MLYTKEQYIFRLEDKLKLLLENQAVRPNCVSTVSHEICDIMSEIQYVKERQDTPQLQTLPTLVSLVSQANF